MAGRRLRDAVKTVLTSGANGEFDKNTHIVIAGLTNTYSQYVTTFEEYQVQRYEVSIVLTYCSTTFNCITTNLHITRMAADTVKFMYTIDVIHSWNQKQMLKQKVRC